MSAGYLQGLPESWRTVPLKHACKLNPEILPETTSPDAELRYVDIAALDGGSADLSPKSVLFENAPSRARRVLRDGDTILSTVRTYLRAVATFPQSEPGLVASTGFAVLRPNGVLSPRFAYWAALSEPVIQSIIAHSEGVSYPAINPSILGTLPLPIPPTAEQERIANFLDEKTARIDALIAEKERLLVLMVEYFDAVLREAVTQGICGKRALKKTGIEWLQAIPDEWKLPKMMSLARVVRGASPRPAGDPRYFDGNFVPWVTVAEITKDDTMYLTETETGLTQEGAQLSRRLATGTLVLSNSGATLGVPKLLAIDACANDGVVAFEELSHEIDIQFAYYYLRSLTTNLRERIRQGAGQPNLNTAIVKGLPVPLPPLDEQRKIIAFVQNWNSRGQSLKEHVVEHINRLRDYRSSLISAAVAGHLVVHS